MSVRSRSLLIFGLASFFSTNLYANNFSYNSIDFRVGGSPTTVGGEFTTQFTENAHFAGKVDSEFEGDWDIAAGVGFNGPMGQFMDIHGQMFLHNVKTSSGDLVGENFMIEFNMGPRIWLYDNIELHGKVGQLVEDDDTHAVFEIGGRFHSTQQLVLGASIRSNGIYGTQFLMTTRFQY
ncbi:hypothetical protein DI392_16315 [Vibrio albus]|uniref:Outer membrane protein beta-barrel domain-containing protein n=1 Tax=Vibrio albus TaxID=2200953 RepID=A0A2U3B628_9VIBR|nr:hypothetical protein [Vibrio albus]PWI32237.1 hypothetical protein DI392_16315 [Vibrio albus]